MDLDIQWIWLGQVKVCMWARVEGYLEVGDFKNMLRRIADAFVSFTGPVVFDLRQARWELGTGDVHAVVAAFAAAGVGIDHKVALVCARDIEQFGDLVYIASGAMNRSLKVHAFFDFDSAVKWLAAEWDE